MEYLDNTGRQRLGDALKASINDGAKLSVIASFFTVYAYGELKEELSKVEQMRFVEEAECTVFHLFSHLPYASARAFAWIARDEQMFRLVGWLLLGRLFANGATPSDRDADEMIDQAMAELPQSGTPVARAAYKALMHYAGNGDEAARHVDSALDRL